MSNTNHFSIKKERPVLKITGAKYWKTRPKTEPKTDKDRFITRQEVADMFNVTLSTVGSWINCGILKPYKVRKNIRFLLSEVKAAATKKGSKEGGANE
jgi:excisionase family DNA binding protein